MAHFDAAAWDYYSTIQMLKGSEPKVMQRVRTVSIEILPEEVVERWREYRLQFLTEPEFVRLRFVDTFSESIELICTVPAIEGTVFALCRSLHVLSPSEPGVDVSYSEPSLPFSVFLSCPLLKERFRVERVAESLIHESLHLQLSLVEATTPLLEPASESELVYSPWRGEARPLRSVLHGVYVFANLHAFWKVVGTKSPERAGFAAKRVESIQHELDETSSLLRSRSLSAVGRQLVASLLRSCS